MTQRGTVLGFYQNRDVAQATLRKLRQNRFLHSSLLQSATGYLRPSDLRHWITRDEALIRVESAVGDMERALALLRENVEDAAVTFVFYPEIDLGPIHDKEFTLQEPLTADRLAQRARELAGLHVVGPRVRHDQLLWQRLRASDRVLRHVRAHLAEATRLEQGIPLAGEWLLDNGRVIRSYVEAYRRDLPRRYYEQLPILTQGAHAGLPRIYDIACELVAATDARVDRDSIHNFLQSYQSVTPLTIGELWAIPLMLRLRLIEHLSQLAIRVDQRLYEREQADFWSNRLLAAVRQEPDALLPRIAELARQAPTPSAHLAEQMLGHLYDEESVLAAVRGWLERKLGMPLGEALLQEQHLQTKEQVSLGNAINSLRGLGQLDWSELFESLSRVDAILWTDPAGVYAQMDFASRDRCRHIIEDLSRRSRASEIDVALQTLYMANDHEDPVMAHVGYYLLDDGRPELEAKIGYRPRFPLRCRRWAMAHPTLLYLGSLLLLTLGLLIGIDRIALHAGVSPGACLLFDLLAVFPVSEYAAQCVNYLITRLMSPRPLPKMWFAPDRK